MLREPLEEASALRGPLEEDSVRREPVEEDSVVRGPLEEESVLRWPEKRSHERWLRVKGNHVVPNQVWCLLRGGARLGGACQASHPLR